jgi:hypothetical protein
VTGVQTCALPIYGKEIRGFYYSEEGYFVFWVYMTCNMKGGCQLQKTILRAENDLLYKFLDPVLLTYDVISGI